MPIHYTTFMELRWRPLKGTSLRGTASFDVFCVKIRAGVLAVELRTNSRVNNLMLEIAHAQKRNPLSDLDEILQDGRYPRLNHVGKFWCRSVKGFRGSGGSNFGFSHWLWSSSLQHSRTTVRVCDESHSRSPVMVQFNTLYKTCD